MERARTAGGGRRGSRMMLRADVYEQLKVRLFAGELRTGQFVSQRELAGLLGATLNPVREAIRKLEAEGLINVYAQRGIQIVEAGPKAIHDAYNYRRLLELDAVRAIAERADRTFVEQLAREAEGTLRTLGRAPSLDARRDALDCDYRFHKALVDFQDNEIVSKHYSMNAARLRLFRASIGEPLQRQELAHREHLEVLEACLAREPERAATLLARHIEVSREHTLGLRPVR